MRQKNEFIETATSANGIDFISCDLLVFGDYGGAGSVGLANINYLKDQFKPHIEEGGFKIEDEDVVDTTELFIANGGYHSQQAWLRDTEENRELLSSLEKYPAFDDQYVSDVESEWEEEAWESWVKRELLDFAEDEIVEDPETGEEITLDELLEKAGDKEEQNKILYYAYKDAMDETDTYPVPEYSEVYINTARIKDSFLKFLKKALVGPFIPSNQQELPLGESKKLIESYGRRVYDASIKNYRRTSESDGRWGYDACIKNYKREGHAGDCPKLYMRDRLHHKNDKTSEFDSMKESRRTTADVSVENQGSVVVLQPLTKKAKLWIDENVSSEPWQWVGNGLVIDWRMAEELIDAMQEEGLILRRN